MLGTDISTSTFHRMLNLFSENYCKWPKQKRVKYRFLMADGTKVRLQAGKGKDLGKGEMRWVMASRGEGKPFYPVGFWINTAWRDIKEELKETINYNNLEVLFADGEKEIQGLLEKGMRFQRCVFHGKKDFAHKLYLDGFKKNKQKGLKDDLAALPVFRFKQENLEKLKEEDKRKVKKLINKSKQGLDDLLKVLDPEKYSNARSYISNLKKHLFTFFDYWLKDGEWVPLTTNAIEGAFSRVKNRIWSIGRRWTERGLLNWLRITIQKIFSPNKWDNFWKKYLKINPNLKLSYLGASWQWIDQNHVTLK